MKPRGSSQNEAHAGAQYTTLEIGIPGGLFFGENTPEINGI
jgi:hypothetical protein